MNTASSLFSNKRRDILSISRLIISAIEEREVTQALVNGLSHLMHYDTMSVYCTHEGRILKPIIVQGPHVNNPDLSNWSIPFGTGIIGSVVQSGKSELVNHAHADQRTVYPDSMEVRQEHLMVFPLKYGENTWGALIVNRTSGIEFSTEEFELAEFLASYASLALNNTTSINKLREKENSQQTILRAIPDTIFRIRWHQNMFEYVDNPGVVNSTKLELSNESKSLFENQFHLVNSSKELSQFEFQEEYDGVIHFYEARLIHICTMECLAMIRDLTEQKQAEQQLEKARQDAERSLKIKKDFLARMSHELRTPINGVLGLSNLMITSELSKENLEYLKGIQTSGNHLLSLVNDVLDQAQLEVGKLKLVLVRFNLKNALEILIEGMRPLADQKGLVLSVSIDLHLPEIIVGDSLRLNQILFNLLSNAIKFTHSGHVKLSVECRKTQTGYSLSFIISDTGIGISDEAQAIIFESFTQADSQTSIRYGGAGIGLSIVKELTALFGGSVYLQSEVNKGAEFKVVLPFNACDIENASITNTPNPLANTLATFDNCRLLVAEDNLMNQLVVQKTLEKWKINVTIAANGREAIEKLKHEKFDLVIMDIQMPEMDGLTATSIIRNEFPEPVRSIPILAMTAVALNDPASKFIAAGMTDYIPKPFKAHELHAMLTNYLRPIKSFPLAERQYINLDYLHQIAPDNPSFISQMISLFETQATVFLTNAKDQLTRKDFTALSKNAHSFKPQGAYLGVNELKDSVGYLEVEARKNGDTFKMEGLIGEAEQLISAMMQEINSLHKTLNLKV